MKIVIYGATEVGCLLATEFFEDHDITVIDKEENLTKLLSKESLVNSEKDKTSSSSHNNSIKKRGISINLIKKNDFIKVINIDGKKKKK